MSLSRHARRALTVVLVAALMAGLGAFCLSAKQQDEPVNIDKIGFAEPSGAVYHTARKTLFIVGDEGDICEIKPDGTLVKKRDLSEGGWIGLLGDPELGRMGLAIARGNSKYVYALVESKKNAIYRSEDGGYSWEKRGDKNMGNRPFYYSEIYLIWLKIYDVHLLRRIHHLPTIQ